MSTHYACGPVLNSYELPEQENAVHQAWLSLHEATTRFEQDANSRNGILLVVASRNMLLAQQSLEEAHREMQGWRP